MVFNLKHFFNNINHLIDLSVTNFIYSSFSVDPSVLLCGQVHYFSCRSMHQVLLRVPPLLFVLFVKELRTAIAFKVVPETNMNH